MYKKRKKLSTIHFIFNIVIIVIPWLSILFLGKRNVKRFWFASFVIFILELISHKIGQKLEWWKFYDRKKSYLTNELPFSIGPYMPLSMWLLKLGNGDLKKFFILNAISDGMFAFVGIQLLNKIKIIGLHRLNPFQFFLYLYHKAFILYGVQYLYDKKLQSS
ncbi:hypothetical protein [Salirhabdus sp. Marseille-P4669]|uniref:hypothetical protein n=1 Tax=Salirhabdus sp. Marseille-P4669 TaxID=2042310 RepID=UPI000C7E2DD4|nr:hypothetical protein [Salirhabdus sp. Marseille-P4669]